MVHLIKSKQSLPLRKTARWSNNLHCHKYRKYFLYVCMRLRCPQALSRLLCKFLDGILVGLTQTQLADGITRAALYEREKVLSHHDYWNRAHCQARLCQVYVALCNFLQTVSTTAPVRYFSTNLTMYILCQDLSIEQESTNIRFRVLGLSFNSRL